MAKGNIGNLLQHFVALNCAGRIIDTWGRSDDPIEYIDCYSMAPWEEIVGQTAQGFSDKIRRFGDLRRSGDLVATTFLGAWEELYGSSEIPDDPGLRLYPNTAVLLATAFPAQRWSMRLHDKKEEARLKLTNWAETQPSVIANVDGLWHYSEHLKGRPADPDRPLLLMLDPYRVTAGTDREEKAGLTVEEGYLPIHWLRGLLGSSYLGLNSQTRQGRKAPVVITLFSYSDSNLNGLVREIEKEFSPGDWSIERVSIGPYRSRPGEVFHRAWIVSHGVPTPLVRPSMQEAWDRWA